MPEINFEAPPTVASFMKSESFGRLIAGPVGSGKTTGCVFELFRRACEQEPAPDGLRYTRFAVVRQTLKQLKDTVLKDIVGWLSGIARYKVSDNTVYIEIGDVRSEWLLIPLDDQEDQRRLLSMQLTGAWMSECIEMDYALIAPLSGRCGRYPSTQQGGATWFGIIADTNMPSEGSDWHKMMELDVPPDWQIFIQPGGLTDGAENLPYLTQTPATRTLPLDHPERLGAGRVYYERLARNNGDDWVKRFVHAQYGDDPSGRAVYKDSFKGSFHIVDDLEPVYGHPLIIGQDFGRDPWSVLCQLDHRGRFLVLEEVGAEDVGLEQHLDRSLRPVVTQPRYFGLPIALIGDPAGVAKNSHYEETSFDLIKRKGFVAFPAPTNNIDPRIRAVEAFLLSQAGGGPGFLIDRKRCPILTRALSGAYRYANTKAGQRKPTPEKNEASHPIDALQYACLAANGGMVTTTIAQRLRVRPTPVRKRPSAAAWT
jgi:hypothetical protein